MKKIELESFELIDDHCHPFPVSREPEDFAGLIFAPQGPGSDMQLNLARDLAARGARIAIITDREDLENENGILIIRQKYANEFFAPLSQIVPVQCFGDYIAKSRGIKVGEFIYGTKVTVIQ